MAWDWFSPAFFTEKWTVTWELIPVSHSAQLPGGRGKPGVWVMVQAGPQAAPWQRFGVGTQVIVLSL